MQENNILKLRYNRLSNRLNQPVIIEEEKFDKVDFKNSLKSVNIKNLNFTNFFTSDKAQKYSYFKEVYQKYISNDNLFKDLLYGDEIEKSNISKLNRLCNIMTQTNNEKVTIEDLVKGIFKFKLKKDNTMQIFIKKEENNFYIYLIDLYHLAIPAINRKTGRSDYTKIYEKYSKANFCLSNIINQS